MHAQSINKYAICQNMDNYVKQTFKMSVWLSFDHNKQFLVKHYNTLICNAILND